MTLILTQSPYKAQSIERYIRTFRGVLRRLLRAPGSKGFWPPLVPKIIQHLNDQKSSRRGNLSPNEIGPAETGLVFRKLYPRLAGLSAPQLKPKFAIGDRVRLLTPSSDTFTKGGSIKASETVYAIRQILFHPILEYRLKDIQNNNSIAGKVGEERLIRVT